MPHTIKLACAAAMTFASIAQAQDAKPETPAKTMTIGDEAPAIDISNWVIGDKVASFDDGKVYVVEFWATWCGPCKASMPHISDLQKQYKDYGVTFIGVSDEPLETVTKFLDTNNKELQKKWSEVIGYTLTTDPDKSVMKDYFTAAGQTGIPTAFIVGKDQHIEWIGHPMQIEKALDAVVKDSWDRAAFKAEWEKEQAADRESMKNQVALSKAMKAKDWKKVIEIADGMLAANPKDANAAMLKFRTLAVEMNDSAKAYEFARPFLQANWDNAMVLNMFAWTIVDEAAIKDKDLKLAMGAAMQAESLTDGKEAAILDTVARCWYEMGNLAAAVEAQEKAVKVAGDDEMGAEIKATLKKYQDELAKKGG